MGLAEDVRRLLSTSGFTAELFVAELPERPILAAAVTPTAGIGPLIVMPGPAAEQAGVQIRVRAQTYQEADTFMSSAHSILLASRNVSISGTMYYYFNARSTPFYAGLNDEENPLFACNYDVWRSIPA